MNAFCSAAMVMPVTCAPKCSAACSDSDPQPQPTSSRVEPGLEAELAADQVELVPLRVADGVRRVVGGPVPARVRHRLVEQQRVEVVGEVVVVADRAPVAQLAVQPAADPGLGHRRRRRAAERADPGRGPDRPEQRRGSRPDSGQPALAADLERVRQRRTEVAGDVELAGDVGLRGTELARPPHHPAYGVRGPQHDQRRVRRAGLGAVPRPQPDRQVAAQERPQRCLQPQRQRRSSPSRPSPVETLVVIGPPPVAPAPAAARRGTRKRSRPASTPGRSATSAGRSWSNPRAATSSAAAAERLVPLPQGLGVVAPERQPVDQPQRRVAPGDLVDHLDRGQEAAGEDVLVDPGVRSAGGEHPVVRHGDRLDPHPAAGCEDPVEGGEVRRPVVVADRLDHLDRQHRVVGPGHRPVVAQVDRHPVGEPGRGDPLAGQRLLLAGQRDRPDRRAAAGRADRQLAPAGADLEHPAALPDPGLVEQPLDLADLRAARSECRRGSATRWSPRSSNGAGRARPSSSWSRRGTAGTGRWTGRSGARRCRGCWPRPGVRRAVAARRTGRGAAASGSGTSVPISAASTVRNPARSSASHARVR